MDSVKVELVKYDMDKTKKRKRANFTVDKRSEESIIDKLERIHKGEKVQAIHEVIWGEEESTKENEVEIFTGKVKFFNTDKGFGFIQPDQDIEDVFFHITSLADQTIQDNDLVEFQISDGPKGLVASKILLID